MSGDALAPGQQLAAARRSQGKSLADISRATRILESRLEALERDDYAAVGNAPAYVTGYVRAYAKQLGLPEKPLVAVLDAYYKHQKSIAPSSDKPIKKEVSVFFRLPVLAGIAALLVFLGLGQWFFAKEQDAKPIIDPERVSTASAAQEAPITHLEKRGDHFIHEDLAKVSSSSKVSSGSSVARELDKIDEETIEKTESKEPGSGAIKLHHADVEQNPQSGVEPYPVDALIAPALIQDAAVVEVDSTLGTDELLLNFSEDCWLEVYSADGRRLTSKIAKKDHQLLLTGKAPFDVKLGNARAASIKVNGRSIDTSPGPGKRVLRIQVGP